MGSPCAWGVCVPSANATRQIWQVDGTLVVGCYDKGAVECDTDAAHSCANLRHKLAAACICRQVPYSNVAILVTCSCTSTMFKTDVRRELGSALPLALGLYMQKLPMLTQGTGIAE